MPVPTPAQIDILRLHRDTCIDNLIPQSIFFHRLPEGTLTLNTPGGAARNKRFTQPVTVRQSPTQNPAGFVSFRVWATYRPQELKVGARDAGDQPAFHGWMIRSLGQMPVIDDYGNLITIQDEDWLQDFNGVFLRCENPVVGPDGASWTFECWSQR